MENLKNMKDTLINKVQSQINGNFDKVNSHELGEAIDMIKDFSQAIYYCTIVEAMEKDKENGEEYMEEDRMYYPRRRMYYGKTWDMPYMYPYYYTENPRYTGGNDRRGYSDNMRDTDSRKYHEDMYDAYRDISYVYPNQMKDTREGKSGLYRKYYMEAKENKKNPNERNVELTNYMKELSNDITEMIHDATPEEKQMLQQKLVNLSNLVIK